MVQWLRFHPFSVEGRGSVRDWGTKISHAVEAKKKSEEEERKVFKAYFVPVCMVCYSKHMLLL